MTIDKIINGSEATLKIAGRLDTTTAPQLESAIKELSNPESLVLDLEGLEYISSAGLRVILSTHKQMVSKGGLTIKHANAEIQEVFDITGLSDVLTIE